MNSGNKDAHVQIVLDWESKNNHELSLDQQVLLLVKGIHAVEQRALKTLSTVTVMVILERVLHQSSEKFDCLLEVTISDGISFKALLNTDKNLDRENLIEALHFLLIDFLRVLGRITAEILTKPLHVELQNVTFESKDNK